MSIDMMKHSKTVRMLISSYSPLRRIFVVLASCGRLRKPLLAPVFLLVAGFVFGGCTATPANLQALASVAPVSNELEGRIAPLTDYVSVASPLAKPTPESGEKQYATVATEIRSNLRSGPGTTFDIVAKASPGDSLELAGQSEDKLWYQVVVPSQGGAKAWISADLVRLGGSAAAVPLAAASDALLPADLSATWKVDWSCNSDRCDVKLCSADVVAQAAPPMNDGYLPIEHTVSWADQCFSTDAWTLDVDPLTGQERSNGARDNFLYGYWTGAALGPANGVYPLDDKRGVFVLCSDGLSTEIEEGAGWTTVYEGSTCHDVKTGMLVYINYVKRWLFTGEFEGKTYERSYFGDSERLQQRLVKTNVELGVATKK